MKLQFIQSGGFAGLIRHCTIDTGTMPPEEAATVERLVRDARLSSPAPPAAASSARDLEEYQISIDDGGDRLTVVREPSSLSAEARALVGYLKKCARPGLPDSSATESAAKARPKKPASKSKPR